MTSLYSVHDLVKLAPPKAPVVILLLSDLLEVCSDWSTGPRGVNLERELDDGDLTLDDTLITPDATKLIDLSHVRRVFVIRAPNRHIKTPVDRSKVEAVWRKAFQDLRFAGTAEFGSSAPAQISVSSNQ